jgi:hypothetical protein
MTGHRWRGGRLSLSPLEAVRCGHQACQYRGRDDQDNDNP